MQEINFFVFIGILMMLAGGVGMCVSLILAFKWKVFDILDELSGRKAKRQIQRLRELNVSSGSIEGLSTNDLYQLWGSGSINLNNRVFDNFDEEVKEKSPEKALEKKPERKSEGRSDDRSESESGERSNNISESNNEAPKDLNNQEAGVIKPKESNLENIEPKEEVKSGNVVNVEGKIGGAEEGSRRYGDSDIDPDDDEPNTSELSSKVKITIIEELSSI